MYHTQRWLKLRRAFLTERPFCVFCEQDGHLTPATVVDHVKPHKGDPEFMWDIDNLQPLCKPHHDSTKARQDHSGKMPGHDELGEPTDPNHYWNKDT